MKRENARQTIAEKYLPKEPSFSKEQVLSEYELIRAYNWYAIHSSRIEKEKFICTYLAIKELPVDFFKHIGPTGASICRLLSKGYKLPEKTLSFLNERISFAKEQQTNNSNAQKGNSVVSIQERINESTSGFIGELEGIVDDLIESKYKLNTDLKGKLTSWEVKSVHANKMLEWAKNKRKEFSEIVNTKDEDLLEGYSNFSKKNLKSLVSFFDQLILALVELIDEKKATRKPRKRKPKTAEQLVSKVNYCKEDKVYGFTSIEPTKILGSTCLCVFNVKTRKIGIYYSQDASGFSLKGSTLINFDEASSLCKTIRKPNEFIPILLKSGKASIKPLFGKIKSKENVLTGRLNADTILLRVS